MKELKSGVGRRLDTRIMFRAPWQSSSNIPFALLHFLLTSQLDGSEGLVLSSEILMGVIVLFETPLQVARFPLTPNRTPEEAACSGWCSSNTVAAPLAWVSE